MADVKKIATRQSYGESLRDFAEEYPNLVVLDADLRRNVPALGRGGRRGDAIPRLGLGADSIGVRFTETYLSRKYT